MDKKFVIRAGCVLLVVMIFSSTIYTVAPDERAVVARFGKIHHTTGPGLHYRLPLVEQVHIVTVERTMIYNIEVAGAEGVLLSVFWKNTDAVAYLKATQTIGVLKRIKELGLQQIDRVSREKGASFFEEVARKHTTDPAFGSSAIEEIEEAFRSDFTDKGMTLLEVKIRKGTVGGEHRGIRRSKRK